MADKRPLSPVAEDEERRKFAAAGDSTPTTAEAPDTNITIRCILGSKVSLEIE